MAKRRHIVRRVVRKQAARRPAVKPATAPPPRPVTPPPEQPPRGHIKCFFLEETGRVALYLRRYVPYDSERKCPGPYGYHHANNRVEDADAIWVPSPHRESPTMGERPERFTGDPRWPTHCACGYEFTEKDAVQVFQDLIYRRVDTGEMYPMRDMPVGAMWYSDWMLVEGSNRYRGPDGRSLHVRVPASYASGNTDWAIDGIANNCTRKDDTVHKCWVRHGVPPLITVDKAGDTCAAGGGSILVPGYHGMLQEGYLREC